MKEDEFISLLRAIDLYVGLVGPEGIFIEVFPGTKSRTTTPKKCEEKLATVKTVALKICKENWRLNRSREEEIQSDYHFPSAVAEGGA